MVRLRKSRENEVQKISNQNVECLTSHVASTVKKRHLIAFKQASSSNILNILLISDKYK